MDASKPSPWRCALVAALVLGAVALALRLGTDAAARRAVWDEVFMQPLVAAIVEAGWTARTAIDYADTKGPVFFWTYAALAEIVGHEIADLRLITLVMFVLAGLPLGLLAARCGLGAGPTSAVAVLYAFLPYNAVLGQIFMSEPSFLLGTLFLALVFLWGFGQEPGETRLPRGPIAFAILLAVLLHHRPHAIALAGAVLLTATARDGARAWPWWIACAAAALLRLPLYLHWGGLVSPAYQDVVGLGLRLGSLTYLAVSLLPVSFVVLVAFVLERPLSQRSLWLVAGASLVGLTLGVLAAPDPLDLALIPEGGRAHYMGMVATALRGLGAASQRAAFAALAALGCAAMCAMIVVAHRTPVTAPRGTIVRLAAWTLVLGWLMYGLTRGVVFDRYMLPFVALTPFLWYDRVPRWLLALEGAGLLAIMGAVLASHGLV